MELKEEKIIQILPDFIKMNIPNKKAIFYKVNKNETSLFINKLKNNNFSLKNIYLKNNEFNIKYKEKYQKPLIDINNNVFKSYDCSFLKRVKNLNENENLILITYIDDLEYRKLTNEELIKNLELKNNNIIYLEIPSICPITKIHYNTCKEQWPMSFIISSKEKYIYEHKNNEEKEMIKIMKDLKNDKNFNSYIYNPLNKKIICKGKNNDKNIIEHSIMNLLDNFSEIINKNNVKTNHNSININKDDAKKDKNNFIFFNNIHNDINDNLIKDYDINSSNQYYCENLYIFTIKEPCIMCSMSLVHNRISRIYYLEDNEIDGGLKTKISINNYNLNHHYLIFKIIL